MARRTAFGLAWLAALVIWASAMAGLVACGFAYARLVSQFSPAAGARSTLVTPAGGSPASARAPEAVNPFSAVRGSREVRLTGDAPVAVKRVTRLRGIRIAPAQPRAPVTVTIVLKRSHPAAFAAFLKALYAPRSSLHGHFPSQSELADRFGPSLSTYQQVRLWLVSEGFRIVQTTPDRLSITARGTQAQAARAFAVTIRDYRIRGRRLYANTAAPAVPRAFAAQIQSVSGLSDLDQPVADPSHVTDPGGLFGICLAAAAAFFPGITFASSGLAGALAAELVILGLTISLALSALIITAVVTVALIAECATLTSATSSPPPPPPAGGPPCSGPTCISPSVGAASADGSSRAARVRAHATGGSGQKIGLLEFDTYHSSDVANWLSLIGDDPSRSPLSRLSEVNVNGGVASPGAGESEVLLDIDAALSIDPQSQTSYTVYDAPPSTSFVQMFQTMIGDGDTVISNSWSQCEDQTPAADAEAIDSVLAEAAASGVTVLNGAGDDGSTCLDGSANTIGVPADSPHATAVGGTTPTFGTGLTYGHESWWNGSNGSPPTGSGGFGTSRYFARPSFQNGLTDSAMRSVPDLSFNADPAAGLELCEADAGGCPQNELTGGTSLAAPEVAAEVADLNLSLGHNVGDLNTALYPLAGSSAFHTPASMSSDFAHVGLGTPNFTAVFEHLSGVSPGAVSATESGAGSLGAPQADGTQQGLVRVTLRDASGLPVTGKSVTLTPDAGSNAQVTPATATTDATDGSVAFTVTDSTAEAVTFTATDTTDNVALAGHPSLTFATPTATGATITGGPGTVADDGTHQATISVYLQNGQGRPAAGKTVSISEGAGSATVTPAGASSPGTTAVTDGSGTATFTATDLSQETVTFTATDVTDGNLPVPGSLLVNFGPSSATCQNAGLTPAAGFSASVFVTGLPLNTQAEVLPGNFTDPGCTGGSPPAFDSAGNAYVADEVGGEIYKFGPSGGTASSGDALPDANFAADGLGNLVFGKDGALYASLSTPNQDVSTPEIVQLDPATGAQLRVVADHADGLPDCPFALAVDPLTGDLFTDDDCNGFAASTQITRIENPASANPTVVSYIDDSDGNLGLAFAPNGTLYVAAGSSCGVDAISGTNAGAPTMQQIVVQNCGSAGVPFGVAVAGTNSSGAATALDVFDFTGQAQRIDLTQSPATSTTVGTGSSQFFVGATTLEDCDFAPIPGFIIRFGAGSGCGTAGSGSGPAVSLTSSGPSPAPTGSSVTFTAQLSGFSPAAGTPIIFTVDGVNPQVQLVSADASGTATFSLQGDLTGSDTVVASALNGTTNVRSTAFGQRWTVGKDVSFLSMNASPESAPYGSPASLRANLTDLSQSLPSPIANAAVTLSLTGASCSATTDASGNAACTVTPSGPQALQLATATYAGDGGHTAAFATNSFQVAGAPPASMPTPPGPTAPVNTAKPKITGTAKAKHTLTCSTGSWSQSPTSYGYRWNRDGTPLSGATKKTYRVQTLDEGSTLTCTVTARNAVGAGAPATSAKVKVPVPRIKGCPAASGSVRGISLGLARLGETRAQARRSYKHSSNRGKHYQDFFCLTPIGVRVGYASPALVTGLPVKQRRALAGRVVWASTSNPIYAIDTIRPGATIAAAQAKLPKGNLFTIGRNRWYLRRSGRVTAVFKVRGGIVQEIGIAELPVTRTRSVQRRFLTSFT
jgi:hypothetical protein